MPRPLLPSELERALPDDGTSISARVRADLEAGREKGPVDLSDAVRCAVWVLRVGEDNATSREILLARAVLAQGTLLDAYEARLAEGERRT